MTDEELKKLPNNDQLAQYCRSLYMSRQKEYVHYREDEIKKCNHLFIKLKDLLIRMINE